MNSPRGAVPHRTQRLHAVEIFGWLIGTVTLLYLMAIPLVPIITGKEIPCSSRFPLIAALAVGCALASGAIGGSATAKGSIPWLSQNNPLTVAATGGIAVLVIVFGIGHQSYVKGCTKNTLHPKEIVFDFKQRARLRAVLPMFKRLANVTVDTSGCNEAALDRYVEIGEIRADGPRDWLEKLSYRVEGPGQAFTLTEVKPEEKYALRCS
jgi:hypothetical protein